MAFFKIIKYFRSIWQVILLDMIVTAKNFIEQSILGVRSNGTVTSDGLDTPWECPTHAYPSRSSVDSLQTKSDYQVDTSATRTDWSRTWRPVEYHQPSSTAPRLPQNLGDLAATTPLTTWRPHVLAPSRRSDKLTRQPPSRAQRACNRCDRVCYSRLVSTLKKPPDEDTIRDAILRDAILTCARKRTWVSLIYRTEIRLRRLTPQWWFQTFKAAYIKETK